MWFVTNLHQEGWCETSWRTLDDDNLDKDENRGEGERDGNKAKRFARPMLTAH